MTKLTAKQWLEIKTKYQMGIAIREIARQYNYDSGNLVRKAKKEGWLHGELQQITTAQVNAINEVSKNTAAIQQLTAAEQHEIINNEIMKLAGIKQRAYEVQHCVLDAVHMAAKQAMQLMVNNPSGKYVKSESVAGITYGRNTEIVKDLSTVINGVNTQITPNSGVTINNQQNHSSTHANIANYQEQKEYASAVQIYLPDNGRDPEITQQLLNDSNKPLKLKMYCTSN